MHHLSIIEKKKAAAEMTSITSEPKSMENHNEKFLHSKKKKNIKNDFEAEREEKKKLFSSM